MQYLSSRPMSGFPVSIGTGLALESLFEPQTEVIDPSREIPNKINPNDYSRILVNLETLIRNCISHLNSADKTLLTPNELFDVIMSEIDFLQHLFMGHNLSADFYVNTYSNIKRLYKDSYRFPNSLEQNIVNNLKENVLNRLASQDTVIKNDSKLKAKRSDRCIIMSHIPFDLLSHDRFLKLDLLESHTGVLKTKSKWNTKYFKFLNNDMSFMPFWEYLLITFGDSVMFKPKTVEIRQKVYNDLIRLKVTPLTSEFSNMF